MTELDPDARQQKLVNEIRRAFDSTGATEESLIQQRYLVVLYAVSRIIADSTTLEDMAEATVRILGEGLRWDITSFWFHENQHVLRHLTGWHDPDHQELTAFVASNASRELRPNEELPGRVWHTGDPVWIEELNREAKLARLSEALRLGLRSALAFPIQSGRRTLGVIEFYSRGLKSKDTDLLESLRAIGSQIGQFIERTHAEEDMVASERRRAAVADAALDAIITIDAKGIILEFNPAAETIFGYTRDEVLGHPMADMIIPPSLRAAHKRGLAHYQATGVSRVMNQRLEMTAMRKDGSEFPVELTITRIGSHGRPLFTGFVRDVTERVRANQDRDRYVEELRQANAAKDRFLALLSHELRTPLTSIVGWAHLLNKGNVRPENLAMAYSVIQRNARLQSRLIDALLDFSAIQNGTLPVETQPVDLKTSIRNAVDSVSVVAATKRIGITVNVPERECLVSGDDIRLQQILWNVLDNAIKFTPENGSVVVDVEMVDDDAVVVIEDNGEGIAPEVLPFIFQPFRQENSSMTRRQGGLGLGLALVHQFVELHGGTISAESPGKNRGTTIRIRLPLLKK